MRGLLPQRRPLVRAGRGTTLGGIVAFILSLVKMITTRVHWRYTVGEGALRSGCDNQMALLDAGIMGLIGFAGFLLAALYLMWKLKYRHPPAGLPQALCYHKITRKFCFEGTWTTPERFFAQIDFLLERGYRFIDEKMFLTSLDSVVLDSLGTESEKKVTNYERPSDGDRRLFLTFDDGYAGIYRHVFPGLQEREIPFHVFIVTDFAGRGNTWDLSLGRRSFRHLSWDEAREMADRGVSFGSHGATHRDLTRLSDTECSKELDRSKSAIEDNLGISVQSFSYPFGRYDGRIKCLIRDAGYRAAFSLYPSQPNEQIDSFALRRNGVYIIDTRGAILRKLERRLLSWFEEMKCRMINGVAVATPLIKDFSRRLDR